MHLWAKPTFPASLSGTVLDPTGAAIAGASVSVVEQRTGRQVTGTTDRTGHFEFSRLSTGRYILKVNASGFRSFVAADAQLTTDQPLHIDAKLAIGSASSTVQVSAAEAPYAAVETSAGTRTRSPLIEVPQSIEVYGGGLGSPLGGLINVVSVRPEPRLGGYVGFNGGNFGTFDPYGDINVPLNSRIAARLSGEYQRNDSWVDVVSGDRWSLQPAMSFQPGPKTNLFVQGLFNHRDQLEYSGVPAVQAMAGQIDRNAFVGAPAGQPHTRLDNRMATAELNRTLRTICAGTPARATTSVRRTSMAASCFRHSPRPTQPHPRCIRSSRWTCRTIRCGKAPLTRISTQTFTV